MASRRKITGQPGDTPVEAPRKQDTLYVSSLAKGLKLLKVFNRTNTHLSLTEMVKLSGMDKSAVQRLANTLMVEGFLHRDPDTKRFRPTHAWLGLAYAYYWSDSLVALAMPKLIELAQRLGETVNMAELSDTSIVYVARLPCQRTNYEATLIGRHLPALSASPGQAILSTWAEADWRAAVETWPLRQMTARTTMDRAELARQMARTAERGFSITQDQMILNEIGISAPIRGADGLAHGAVQCSVSAFHWTPERVERELVPYLLDTANSIAPAGRG
ncbi:IclR family transcriptional regulator [Leisingera sp. XS_AS12]|uniref:IclR family transcriptional regulator n=1 Tax=Leisingera sp. XS_AS12 TaxID=3241294 RepID=UPI003516AB27